MAPSFLARRIGKPACQPALGPLLSNQKGRRADALPVVSICGAAEPMIEDCPEEMLELRATLLQEHVWRQREGLLQMITGSGVRLPVAARAVDQ